MLLRVHFFLLGILCRVLVGIDVVRTTVTLVSEFFRYSLWRMLCNYSIVECDVFTFLVWEKQIMMRMMPSVISEKKLFVFNFHHILQKMDP